MIDTMTDGKYGTGDGYSGNDKCDFFSSVLCVTLNCHCAQKLESIFYGYTKNIKIFL